MSKQAKTLTAVAVVFVALVAALIFLLNGGLPAEESSSSSSSGTALFAHEAADITKVTVSGGSSMSYTGDGAGGVTADDMGDLPVNSGYLTYVAKYAASLTGQEQVSDGGDLDQFGLGANAVKVDVAYKDGSGESFLVGNEVPGSEPGARYVLYNGSVWTAYSTHVKYFMYGRTDLVDKTITPDSKDTDGSTTLYDVSSVTMTGAGREAPFVLSYKDSNSVSGYTFTNYAITSPEVWSFTYDDKGTKLLYSAFGISAEEVAACDPTDDDLAQYGLAEPYASVAVKSTLVSDKSEYDFTILTSEPADGYAYMMREGVPVVYKVAVTDGMSWINAVYTDYINGLLLTPNIKTISKISIDTPDGNITYSLKFGYKEESSSSSASSSEEPEEELLAVTETSTYPGAAREANIEDIENFRNLYQTLISSSQESWAEDVPAADALVSVVRITYYYRDGGSDYVEFYEGPVRQCYIGLNGNVRFLTRSSMAEKIIADSVSVTNGTAVEG